MTARFSLLAVFCLGMNASLPADEGMWLFDDLPLKRLREKYQFQPGKEWVENLMRSALRLSSGGSGSFVSAEGLVLTNHHVGSDALQKLSTPERNLMKDGFIARSREGELRCPDLEVVTLVGTTDVTGRVNGAVPIGADPAAADKARREMMATIEKESMDSTGLQSEVVTLYKGGKYHLYRYKRYEDVRLVMAPEGAIAFFGGDVDNFEYPRTCLDICLFRVYENDKPAKIEHYLQLDPGGAREGEPIYVAGHPGRTQRLYTVDHLRFLRDVEYPAILANLVRREIALQQFSLRGEEPDRIAKEDLFGIQNGRKAVRGILAGLLDTSLFAEKARREAEIRGRVGGDSNLGASQKDWDQIARSLEAYRDFYGEYQLLEGGRGFWSRLFGYARMLVRLAEESEKPNAERLPGYRESDLPSLELRLYSPAPIYPELERIELADSLTFLATTMGAEHPLTQMVLSGRSPEDRAGELVSGTDLRDVAFRKELAKGGTAAIRDSKDPLVALARTIDPYARALRKRYEDLVQGVQRQAYGNISRALFAIRGTDVYPDATFTLRLAFGVAKGLEDQGKKIPFFTTLGEAFERHARFEGKEPYQLPKSWLDSRGKLNLLTPINFISTADIIGGNSGSPVVNRQGKLVGVIFDGNIYSLVLDIVYTEEKARAISVCSQAILEALKTIYGAGDLAAEMAGGN